VLLCRIDNRNFLPSVFLRLPILRQLDHATTNVSTFWGKLHPSNNFNKKLPETSSRTLQTASTLPHPNCNNFAKEEVKTIYTTTACSSHNLLTTPKLIYASALHTCQLDLCAETPTLRSLSIRQFVVKKEKRKTKTKLNRQPHRLLVSAISACMHIPACMCSHGSLSIWYGHFPCQLDLQTLSLILKFSNFLIFKLLQ
jgi:hypothetical protein